MLIQVLTEWIMLLYYSINKANTHSVIIQYNSRNQSWVWLLFQCCHYWLWTNLCIQNCCHHCSTLILQRLEDWHCTMCTLEDVYNMYALLIYYYISD